MRLPEQRLWDSMRNRLKGRGIRLERIENAVGSGRPDIDALYKGNFTTIELKAVEAWPARPLTPVLGRKGLNPDQQNWHMDWASYGGRSLIIVGVGTGNEREVFAFLGTFHDQINTMTQAAMRAFCSAKNWDSIERLLKEPA